MTTQAPRVIAALLGPAGDQIGCDECFDLLDAYVDGQHAGRDADAETPGMRAHLAGCPACQEEHESLAALIAIQPGDEPHA
jgi:anti-sigma factor RsiW